MEQHKAQDFNDAKHGRGEWDTTMCASRNRLLRFCASLLSQKRKGVDELAGMVPNAAPVMVLDAGAGQGAYSVWFASASRSMRCAHRVVGVDISFTALQRAAGVIRSLRPVKGSIAMVCADLHALPFRQEQFSASFSIDTLGHVADVNKVLDELLRCVTPGAPLFLHSECADIKKRWPDRMLIRRLGRDLPAEQDGHTHLLDARDVFVLYSRRFRIVSFANPAGYLGWFLGYPEKYRPAFAAAGLSGFAWFLSMCAFVKKTPVLGLIMRLKNALSNHLENYLGLTGGGSCFAFVKKPT
jgi:SAM-dependent methyltransferase